MILPFDVTDHHLAYKALQGCNRQLQMLLRQLLEVQDAERRRITAELHDQIGQLLTTVKLGLQGIRIRLDNRTLGKQVGDLIDLAAEILDEVRSLSLDLHPPLLNKLRLRAAPESHVKNLSRQTGLEISFVGDEMPKKASSKIAIACFGIAQEALTNMMRHAKATRVLVRLHARGDAINLWGVDDGIGLAPDTSKRNAVGKVSISMAERAAPAGARFDLNSAIGDGTTVHPEFPVYP